MKKTLAFSLIALLFTVVSCKKTVEGEQRKFEANVKSAQELAIDFPSFKKAITDQIAAAQTAFTEAEKISDEKQKIEAMSKANSMLSGNFIADLNSIKTTQASIKTVQTELVGLNLEDADKNRIKRHMKNTDDELKTATNKLNQSVASISDAEILAKKIKEDLNNTKSNLDKLLSEMNAKIAKTKDSTAKTSTDTTKQQAATIKCPYCDTPNEANYTKCKSCGAPK